MEINSLNHLSSDLSLPKPASPSSEQKNIPKFAKKHQKTQSLSIKIDPINEKALIKQPSSPYSTKNGVFNVYGSKKTSMFTNSDNVIEISNIYKPAKKDSIFELGYSRIEAAPQDNMVGSGALSGFLDNNVDNSAIFKVLPCFLDDKGFSPLKKSSVLKNEEISMSQSKDSAPEFMINVYNMKKTYEKCFSPKTNNSNNNNNNKKIPILNNESQSIKKTSKENMNGTPQLKRPEFTSSFFEKTEKQNQKIEKNGKKNQEKNKKYVEKPNVKEKNNAIVKKTIKPSHTKSNSICTNFILKPNMPTNIVVDLTSLKKNHFHKKTNENLQMNSQIQPNQTISPKKRELLENFRLSTEPSDKTEKIPISPINIQRKGSLSKPKKFDFTLQKQRNSKSLKSKSFFEEKFCALASTEKSKAQTPKKN